MSEPKISAIYPAIFGKSMRIVVRSKIDVLHDRYDIYRFSRLRDLTADVVKLLAAEHQEFLVRLSEIDDRELMGNKHRKRRYIAERQDLLYLNSPHLNDQAQKVCGYWIATNIGRKEASEFVRMACLAAEVRYESIANIKF